MIPQQNAVLRRVVEQGRTDVWRESEAGGDGEVWAGAAPAYYQEKRQRTSSGVAEDYDVIRSLIVEEGRPAVAFDSEQLVTFTRGGAPEYGEVLHVERRTLPGAGPVQTTRLTLKVT